MRVGIVAIDDLMSRSAWRANAIDAFVRAAGLVVGGAVTQRFAPPRVVVAIAPAANPDWLGLVRPWLANAARVVIVRDHRTTDADPDAWAAELAALPSAEVAEWRDDASCRAAIERARAVAATVAPDDAPAAPEPEPIELPVGTWIDIDGPAYAIRPHCVARLVRELATPPIAIRLDDRAWEQLRVSNGPFGRVSLGVDPHHPAIGWRSARMGFYWSYAGALLAAGDHDFPCGPAKKLWGTSNNYAVQVVMAPRCDAVVARFDHDVLVTSTVPIAWHAAGDDLGVAAFPHDRRRAVLFAQDPAYQHPEDPLDEDARGAAPTVVLGPDDAVRYAVDLRWPAFRITHPGAEPLAEELGDGGFAVYDADHRLVRRADGRLLGGAWRWATVAHANSYWREDLATGVRVRLAPIDELACTSADDETIARDAAREGRHDDAARIRARYPAASVGALDAIAVPGTKNVLLVGAKHLRLI